MRTKIGLVEDDDKVRHQFAQAINSSEAFEVWFETGSMHSAIEWMSHCPRADWPPVWLIDLGLSDGDGMSVIRHALMLHASTQILVVSMLGDAGHVLDCISMGASGYILKGVDELPIGRHVDELLKGGSPLSPQIARHVLNRFRHIDLFRQQHSGSGGYGDIQAASTNESKVSVLTSRQRDVLSWIARGYSYDEISSHLHMGTNTVRTHIRKIYAKLGVHSKVDAINEAHRISLLQVAHDTGSPLTARSMGASKP